MTRSQMLDWADGATPRLSVALPELARRWFQTEPVAAADQAIARRWRRARRSGRRLALADVRADLLQRHVSLGALSLSKPQIELARDQAGDLSLEQWR